MGYRLIWVLFLFSVATLYTNATQSYYGGINFQSLIPKCTFYSGNTLSNCIQPRTTATCKSSDEFRTFDGTCNNLYYKTRGAAKTPFRRIVSPDYIDGGHTPRGSPCRIGRSIHLNVLRDSRGSLNFNRWKPSYPTAHEVSRNLFTITTNNVKNMKGLSTLFMTFGQFLDHDMTATPHESCKTKSCTSTSHSFKYPCFPIKFHNNKPECTGFARSKPVCQKKTYAVRNQMNMITSYIDAGQVYGNDAVFAKRLRIGDGSGKLKLTKDHLLPLDPNLLKECKTIGGCSLVGDERGDENIALHSMHTLWVREHNRISEKLKHLNKHWNGDKIYNTARKIVGGMLQHITYNEYIPNIAKLPRYRGYIKSIDGSIINSFASAAFRYGHSLIPNAFSQIDVNFNKVRDAILLQKAFHNTDLIHKNGIESTLIGLCANQSNTINMEFSEAVVRKLFVPFGKAGYDDLAARNIQRGRDHGIHTYGAWRHRCNLKPLRSFYDLNHIMQKGAAQIFKKIYQHPNDIDLFAAGIAENHLPGLIVGATFNCIFRHQFYGLREGDRFFYLNRGIFTTQQQNALKSVTLAKVLCNNLKGLVSVQKSVFKSFYAGARRSACKFIHDLDLNAWKDNMHTTHKPTNPVRTTHKRTNPVHTTHKPTSPVHTTHKPTNPVHTTRKPTSPVHTTHKPTSPVHTTQKPSNPPATSCNIGNTYSNCIKRRTHAECKQATVNSFRTHDGTCNSLWRKTWGATTTPLRRMTPAAYIDGIDTPRGFPCIPKHEHVSRYTPTANKNIPTAHEVSIKLFTITTKDVKNRKSLSTLFMTFGQFLDHDMSLTPHESCKTTDCSNTHKVYQYPCFPIKFNDRESRCTGFARSKPVCPSTFYREQRNQVNLITSYIDAGNVYGSESTLAKRLRMLDGSGKLKLTKVGLLQLDPHLVEKCKTKGGCSLVGDERGDENIALHSMHTLWVREHNRIAQKLKYINPYWNGELIYNTARKIVGALFQHIAYTEYIPKLAILPSYKKYNRYINPSIVNGFSSAAYRFGHSLIPNAFSQLDKDFNQARESILLQKAFFNTEHIKKHGIESTIMGLMGNQSNEVNMEFVEGVGRKLFVPFGMKGYDDLMARNIQRGRDHGIPTYGTWRQRCGLKPLSSFYDLNRIMQNGAAQIFKKLYKHPNDIDLFAAGIAENHYKGHVVGETFSCIFRNQFYHLREGDRFFYGNPGVFTYAQLAAIKKVTMAKILCNNLHGVISLQKDIFHSFYAGGIKRAECTSIPDLDLSQWRTYQRG